MQSSESGLNKQFWYQLSLKFIDLSTSEWNTQKENGENIAKAEGNLFEDDQKAQPEGDSETTEEPIRIWYQEESKETQDFNQAEEEFERGSSEGSSSESSSSSQSESEGSDSEEQPENRINQNKKNMNDNKKNNIIKNMIKEKEVKKIEKLQKIYEDKFITKFLRR